jgi:predicted nuclease of predicted toxin-antitoxin system
VNVLLDECVPARLTRSLTAHSVTTVQKHGWSGTRNGELLALAQQEFDAFVTVDRKLATQQDLTTFRIPVLLIRARTNRLEHIRPLAAELLEQLPNAARGELTVIGR